jgi:hypothetical protein
MASLPLTAPHSHHGPPTPGLSVVCSSCATHIGYTSHAVEYIASLPHPPTSFAASA